MLLSDKDGGITISGSSMLMLLAYVAYHAKKEEIVSQLQLLTDDVLMQLRVVILRLFDL